MGEVNLSVIAAVTDKRKSTEEEQSPAQEINSALKECTFGLFHYRVLFTSFLGQMAIIFVTNTTPFILSNAECDLHMDLIQKGVLNGMPFVGMLLSSVVAGFLTDTFGRKIFLVWGFGGIFLFTVLSGISQTYGMLVTVKLFEGILLATAFNPAVAYIAEFSHNDVRDRVLLFQSSFMPMGQVILVPLTWGILVQDWKMTLFGGYIVLNTWNFYLLIVSSFSFTACILYYFLPESPKFLLTKHKYKEAREILIEVYKQNTRKPTDTFSHINLWTEREKLAALETSAEKKLEASFKHQLVVGLQNTKPMFRKPLVPFLALFCFMNFLDMVLYNVTRLWFPQLSTIVEHYSKNDSGQDLCVMLDAYTSDMKLKVLNITAAAETCVPTKSGTETYINSIILGCLCLVPFMLSGVLVNKVGKKCLILVAGLISIGATLWLRWASSKVEVVALFAIDLGIGQTIMSLLQAMTIEVFSTTTRTLAISMMMMAGRTGTLVGNVAFPVLLNMGCVVPFFTLAGIMTCVTIMSLLLPNEKKIK